MPVKTPRGFSEETAKHFRGTPAARLRAARRLGRRALELFLATLPEGTSRRAARDLLAAAKRRGRRRSRAIEALSS